MPRVTKQNQLVSAETIEDLGIEELPEGQTDVLSKSRFVSLVLPIGLSVLLLAGAAIAFTYYNKAQKPGAVAEEAKADAKQATADEVKSLIAEVGNIMVLPQGEQPTVATVSDLAKLKDQDFFNNAKLGDKILIYTQAKKAILYNPSSKKIVEVAPVNVAKDQATTKTTTSKSKVLGTDDDKTGN